MTELERFDPSMGGKIASEHWHRYAVCRDHAYGLEVLDVASGEGYGSALLARVAARVVGVDLDEDAVARAGARYLQHKNLRFETGDCRRLRFEDSSFDLVVSMETLEHIREQRTFIDEVKRVLRPNGLFIVSTPNPVIYTQEADHKNPFHLREVDQDEFLALLGPTFAHVELLGQRMYATSLIGPLAEESPNVNETHYQAYRSGQDRRRRQVDSAPVVVDRVEYMLAICSDAAINWRTARHSVYVDSIDDIWREQQGILRWASGLHQEDEQLRAELSSARALQEGTASELAALRGQGEALEQAKRELGEAAATLTRVNAETDDLRRNWDRLAAEHRLDLAGEYATVATRIAGAIGAAPPARADFSEGLRLLMEIDRARDVAGERQIAAVDRARLLEQAAADLRAGRNELEASLTALRAAVADHVDRQAKLEEELAAERARSSHGVEVATRALEDGKARERALRESLDRETGRRNALETALRSREAENRQQRRDAGAVRRDAATVLGDAERLRAALGTAHRLELDFLRAELQQSIALAKPRPAPGGPRRDPGRVSFRAKRAIDAADGARDKGDFAEAARQYGLALRSAPHLLPIWVQYGNMLKETGDHCGSEAAYLRAIEAGPDVAESYRQLGHVRKLMSDFKGSLEAYTSAFERDPHLDDIQPEMERAAHSVETLELDDEARGALEAGNEARDRKDWEAAAAHFGRLLRRAPHVSTIWIQFGHTLRETGHGRAAVRAYNKAVGLRPLSAEAWLQLGRSLDAVGDPKAAHLALQRALALRPGLDDFRTGLAGRTDVAPDAEGLLPGEPDLPGIAAVRFDPEVDIDWPTSTPVYWLPQRLRDLLVDRYGEDFVPMYSFLMGLIDRFAHQPAMFRPERDALALIERIRTAALRASREDLRASIVIPVYNNLVYTLTCIASILEQATEVSFEIIVADDRSTDQTNAVLSKLGGCIRVVRQAANLGFLKNCNAAAEVARGDIVILLNNDTLVLPGWLDALVGTFDLYPDAGFVGSKLINGDGSLQEAGGIFWRDGSAWNFGRDADAALPEFNYVKEVDYVSGASIAVPRALWNSLGGFDPLYSPAYCEDSDLAFRVRAHGRKTLYQPYSALIHHEGRSHGSDLSSGIKAYQVVNQHKLLERWKETLERDHFANGENVFVARDRSRYKPHILFIDHYIPQWDRDAGSRTIYLYMKLFCDRGFQVTFWPENLNEDRDYIRQLQDLGVEVIYSGAYAGRFPIWLDANRDWIDYAFVSRPHVAQHFLEKIAATRIKVLYYGHDLHFRRTLKEYEVTGNPALLERAESEKALERSVWRDCQVIFYPSAVECDEVRGLVPPRAQVVPFPITFFSDDVLKGTDAKLAGADHADPRAMMFVGGFSHTPNVDAVIWFVDEVMPRLRAKSAGFILRVAGSNAPDSVKALAGADVEILGRIDEAALQALYETSGLAILPLRYGAGVKGKLIEAFASGIPVVSTTVGVQGVADPGSLALVADEADRFADQIVGTAANRPEAVERAKRALGFIWQHYSENSAIDVLAPHVAELRKM